MPNNYPRCPICHSTKVWRKGFYPTRHGMKQRFVCLKDGHTFYAPKPRKSKKATT